MDKTSSSLMFEGSAPNDDAFILDIDGFEGPLDVLLLLARQQKVDLRYLSILELVSQYLIFIEESRLRRLDLAADYLVMAAWLTYLKSKLLLPEDKESDEPSGEEMAQDLAERLARLQKLREFGEQILERPQLGHDVYASAFDQEVSAAPSVEWQCTLGQLVNAYAHLRQKDMQGRVTMEVRQVWSLHDVREVLERLIGSLSEWTPLSHLIEAQKKIKDLDPKSLVTSGFAASLELARDGSIDLYQDRAFAPLMLRERQDMKACPS